MSFSSKATRLTLLLATVATGVVVAPRLRASDAEALNYEMAVRQSLEKNAAAASLAEWESSGVTPADVLAAAQADATASGSDSPLLSLCEALDGLRGRELTLFDNAIADARETGALPCAAHLLAKLEAHWDIQEREFAASMVQPELDGEGDADTAPPQLSVRRIEIDPAQGLILTGSPKEGVVKAREVSITIDDGPHATHTSRILKALQDAKIKANFFSQGINAHRYSSLIKQEYADGHVVGSHSLSHPDMKRIDKCGAAKWQAGKCEFAQAKANILAGRNAVENVLGNDAAPFFRFPYGSHNRPLDAFVANAGLTSFLWNIDTLDWQITDSHDLWLHINYRLSAQKNLVEIERQAKAEGLPIYKVIIRYMRELEAKGQGVSFARSGIILIHDTHRQTAVVLPRLLGELARQKYGTAYFAPKGKVIP